MTVVYQRICEERRPIRRGARTDAEPRRIALVFVITPIAVTLVGMVVGALMACYAFAELLLKILNLAL